MGFIRPHGGRDKHPARPDRPTGMLRHPDSQLRIRRLSRSLESATLHTTQVLHLHFQAYTNNVQRCPSARRPPLAALASVPLLTRSQPLPHSSCTPSPPAHARTRATDADSAPAADNNDGRLGRGLDFVALEGLDPETEAEEPEAGLEEPAREALGEGLLGADGWAQEELPPRGERDEQEAGRSR